MYVHLPSSCPLPLTGVQPRPVTALQYEIELIVVLFNMDPLNKSINALGSCVPPCCPGYGELTFNPGRAVKCRLGSVTGLPVYYTVMNSVVNCHSCPSLSFTIGDKSWPLLLTGHVSTERTCLATFDIFLHVRCVKSCFLWPRYPK